MRYEKGALLLLSEGEYSDYSVMAQVRVLKPFDTQEVVAAYLALNPKHNSNIPSDYDKFIHWLILGGYVEETTFAEEWHMSVDL